MPTVPKHRKPIVDAAVTLFRRQGYAGTGLNDIVDISGAPKGSLYHASAGKASIAVAAVEEAGRRVAETMTALAAERDDGGPAASPFPATVRMAAEVRIQGWLSDNDGVCWSLRRGIQR